MFSRTIKTTALYDIFFSLKDIEKIIIRNTPGIRNITNSLWYFVVKKNYFKLNFSDSVKKKKYLVKDLNSFWCVQILLR